MIVHQEDIDSHSVCPVTGAQGQVLRRRESWELANAYETRLGCALPDEIISKYFQEPITEYYASTSDLRWYAPCHLGDSHFYETLASIFDWYYQTDTWDKSKALELIQSLQCKSVVEVGCGEGHFLKRLREIDADVLGVDLNQEAIRLARNDGHEAYTVKESEGTNRQVDCLCAFQTIEHVYQPVDFLADYVSRFHPKRIILSAPSHDTLLGYTSDPLAWPPHHATQWSQQAFECLAQRVGFNVTQVYHDRMRYGDLKSALNCEGRRRLPGMPYVPHGLPGKLLFHAYRMLGANWASRRHSILVVMESETET